MNDWDWLLDCDIKPAQPSIPDFSGIEDSLTLEIIKEMLPKFLNRQRLYRKLISEAHSLMEGSSNLDMQAWAEREEVLAVVRRELSETVTDPEGELGLPFNFE